MHKTVKNLSLTRILKYKKLLFHKLSLRTLNRKKKKKSWKVDARMWAIKLFKNPNQLLIKRHGQMTH